jgi:hypothetical protein
MTVRIGLALGVLVILAGCALNNILTGGAVSGMRHAIAVWSVPAVVVLLAAAVGVGLQRWWGRWLALAVGVSGTITGAFVLGLSIAYGPSRSPWPFANLLGPVLIACLAGPSMYDQFEGRAGRADSLQAAVVRWAVITNIASFGALLFENIFFVRELGNPQFTSTVVFSLAAMTTLLLGVLLAARGKTAGLLLLAAAAVAVLVSVGALLFENQQPPALVLAASVAPGALLALIATLLFARPIWRYLRA